MAVFVCACAFALMVCAPASALRAVELQFLGNFFPQGLSADGSAVIGSGSTGDGVEPALWKNGTLQHLGKVPGTEHMFAQNISGNGEVVVGEDYSVNGYRWTAQGGFQPLEGFGIPFAASHDGSVIVGSGISGSNGAIRWTQQASAVYIGDLVGGGTTGNAFGVSADGAVIVGHRQITQNERVAFRWTAASGAVPLGDLPGGDFFSEALAVSPNGAVVVGRGTASGGQEPFRWTAAGGLQGLGHLPNYVSTQSFSSEAAGVSPDGSIVVGQDTVGLLETETFFWTPADGIRSLASVLSEDYGYDTTGWTLESALISADGTTLAGRGQHVTHGTNAVWRAVIPEPRAMWLIVVALAILASARKRGLSFGLRH
jgi:probable HAF family extracellular repeat protein